MEGEKCGVSDPVPVGYTIYGKTNVGTYLQFAAKSQKFSPSEDTSYTVNIDFQGFKLCKSFILQNCCFKNCCSLLL